MTGGMILKLVDLRVITYSKYLSLILGCFDLRDLIFNL